MCKFNKSLKTVNFTGTGKFSVNNVENCEILDRDPLKK